MLPLPRSRWGLRGYLDPSHPHAVNHLIVSYLGHEEILVAACDDGDVISYTTRSIFDFIQQKTPDSNIWRYLLDLHQPLLLRNVGRSAWGIAVHKAARLIAVSSNSHNISVFAFALGGELLPERSHDLGNEGAETDTYSNVGSVLWERESKASCSPHDRSARNVELILEGHKSNIPNIAFCNTGSDPLGQYIVSIDIDSAAYVWDVWQRKIVADMSHSRKVPYSSEFPYACEWIIVSVRECFSSCECSTWLGYRLYRSPFLSFNSLRSRNLRI